MSGPTATDQPKPLQTAVDQWKAKHKLANDDPALWLIELFEIHRSGWEKTVQPEISFSPVDRDRITSLSFEIDTLSKQLPQLIGELRRLNGGKAMVTPTYAAMAGAFVSAIAAGVLIGRFLL